MAASSWKRSIAKAAVWKVIGITMLIAISWLAGATIYQIGGITVMYHGIMLIFYVLHERFWTTVTWGKIPLKDTD